MLKYKKKSGNMANLKLINAAKVYGNVPVLTDINLDIKQGELIVFVGPSGCGKSTLLRMIAGLEKISSGYLEIDGERMNDVPPAKRGIAMVFQSYALYPHLTVRDNMSFALKIAKIPSDKIDKAVEQAAASLQLTDYLDRLPKALSGGQRQRVAIGRAIVRDPKIFLFDEPLSNLDAALRVATRIEIAQLKEKMPDSTMIYVTHDQVEAMTLATRIVVLNKRGIEQVGTPLELYEKPVNKFVATFIGSPAMNILPAKVVDAGETTYLELENGASAQVPIATESTAVNSNFSVGARPEDMVVTQGDHYVYKGVVSYIEALGEVTLLYFNSNKGAEPVIVKIPGIQSIERGQELKFSVAPEKLQLFDENDLSCKYH
jgi:alpha-glucoside transport system ATP-binding protein